MNGREPFTSVTFQRKFDDGDFTNATLMGRIGKGYTGGNNVDTGNLVGKNDKFGRSVSFDSTGKRLAVGATGDDGKGHGVVGAGAVYLITFDDTSYDNGQIVGVIGAGYNRSNTKDVNLLPEFHNTLLVFRVELKYIQKGFWENVFSP